MTEREHGAGDGAPGPLTIDTAPDVLHVEVAGRREAPRVASTVAGARDAVQDIESRDSPIPGSPHGDEACDGAEN